MNRNIGVQDDVKEIDSNELTANRNKQKNEKIVAATTTVPPAPTASPTTLAPVTALTTRSTTIKTSSAAPSRPRRPVLPIAPVVPITPAVVSNVPSSNAGAQSETNSLLDSALKQDNFIKILKPEVFDAAVTNPTTIEDDATEAITTDAPTTMPVVRTTPEFLYTRIIPELVERGDNVITPQVEPILSIFNAQSNNHADELIRNIKQLQNSLLESSTTTSPPPTEKPAPSVRVALPRRFLFKADSLKNKLGTKH